VGRQEIAYNRRMAQTIILIIAGVVPSILWLVFFLSRDCHPEPKKRIAQTFVLGIALAPIAIAAQWLFVYMLKQYAPGFDASSSPIFFGWAALVEEVVKLMAVTYVVYQTTDFDEPVDGMIYMITAALGFAAIENVLKNFDNISNGAEITFNILLARTFGSTVLHALSSALLGYFVALSWFVFHHSRKIVWTGIAMASIFHFLFNMLLVTFTVGRAIFLSEALLFVMGIFVFILFAKTRDRSPSQLSTDSVLAKAPV